MRQSIHCGRFRVQLLACHVSKDRTCIPGTRTLPNHQQSMHNMYHSSEERKSHQLDRYRWPACLRCVNRWWFVVVCCEIQVLSIDKYKIIKAVAQSADKTRLAGRREEAGSDPCLFLSNFLLYVSPWGFTPVLLYTLIILPYSARASPPPQYTLRASRSRPYHIRRWLTVSVKSLPLVASSPNVVSTAFHIILPLPPSHNNNKSTLQQ